MISKVKFFFGGGACLHPMQFPFSIWFAKNICGCVILTWYWRGFDAVWSNIRLSALPDDEGSSDSSPYVETFNRQESVIKKRERKSRYIIWKGNMITLGGWRNIVQRKFKGEKRLIVKLCKELCKSATQCILQCWTINSRRKCSTNH